MWRFGLGIPLMALILYFTKALPRWNESEAWMRVRRGFLFAVLLGIFGIGVEATLFFLTLEHVGAALTGIYFYLYPAFVALISHFFLKERLSGLTWACIGLTLLGCFLTVDFSALMMNSGTDAHPAVDSWGILFGVLTAMFYSVYLLIGNRLVRGQNSLVVSSGIVLGAFLAFATLALIDAQTKSIAWVLPVNTSSWKALLGLAIVASVLPFSTLYAGMKRVGATQASLLSTLEMVFTIILAAVFLGEKLTLTQCGGAFLILLSVLLIQRLRPE